MSYPENVRPLRPETTPTGIQGPAAEPSSLEQFLHTYSASLQAMDRFRDDVHNMIRSELEPLKEALQDKEPGGGGAPTMDYEEKYLDLLQESVKEIKNTMHDTKTELLSQFQNLKDDVREREGRVDASLKHMEQLQNQAKWSSWALVAAVVLGLAGIIYANYQVLVGILGLTKHG